MPYLNAWMVLLPETGQAVVVLINAGSQLEFFGANEVMSRLPVGIVNILRGEEPPAGLSLNRFYVVFDAVVVGVIGVQLWSLQRVARQAMRTWRGAQPVSIGATLRVGAPLLWELLLSVAILLVYPAAIGAGWQGVMLAMPDITVVVGAVCGLWLATGTVRLLRIAGMVRARRARAQAAALAAPSPRAAASIH
jgi:hypothetical protein